MPTVPRSGGCPLIGHVAARPGDRAQWAGQRLALLSAREREVAEAVAEGLSNEQISTRLHLSVGTVKAHLSSALTKLDLNNRVQLALLTHEARP
ncbi:DNA-binding NarL/FixJ family response regulator [Streptomyces sp. B3I7]|uniref:response regulator transcription factor n=1 Tax=Streptomyces sp. B3I7 TaxID=3042269 RepID=UPI00278835D7|nr:DNA-binding NarL/FixJ family response regulator [Streptomyces sp. B3I7]